MMKQSLILRVLLLAGSALFCPADGSCEAGYGAAAAGDTLSCRNLPPDQE